jgi:hypothetical protein
MLNLDSDVRERRELAQALAIKLRFPRISSSDRDYRPEMARSQSPYVQIGNCVTVALDSFSQMASHVPVGVHVEQDGPRVAN